MPEEYDILNPKSPVSTATKIMNWLQGRTTGWLIAFFITGNSFHIVHHLDATYITFMTTFMGFVLGHSYKEDFFAQKKLEGNQ